jgi:predicted hydrocarbon binding protein
MPDRRYKFSWDFIGDMQAGRPNLGNTTRIEVYRLFQYTLRDILEETYGTEAADRLLYRAGQLAGTKFCEKFVGKHDDLSSFVSKVEQALIDLNIGILRIEQADVESAHFVLTVSEDLDCSGLPDIEHAVCTYDEGFIAGLFHTQTGKNFEVKEIDCWCTGDRTCRFEIKLQASDGRAG